MFDPTKPVQTRDGRKARIVATGVSAPVPGLSAYRQGDETILAVVEDFDGEERTCYFYERGVYNRHSEMDRDLVNIPDRKVTYRTFKMDEYEVALGGCIESTYASAATLISPDESYWHGVLKITEEDGKPVAIEVVTA